ncbi:MAG: T9SS type A sorting domain-containing protein [Calditrichaeota bacterium]|nr:T9SS type A sorting domain-containing protein [Calditrichota bacterium]MCB9392021.1 T9SS type A sorting domain-containing protein [Calditrichota bacterium]
MSSNRLKLGLKVLIAGLLLLAASEHAQAQLVIRGFGMSGQPTALDSVVEQNEFIFVTLAVQVPADWVVDGVGFEGGPRFRIQAFYYPQTIPFGQPVSSSFLNADSLDFIVNDGVDPQRIEFRVRLPEVLGQQIRSVQLALAVIGRDGNEDVVYSQARASHIDVLDFSGLGISPDLQRITFLQILPASLTRPTIHEPVTQDTVSSSIEFLYDLPQDAVRGTLELGLRETPPEGGLLVHRLYLADTLAGTDKALQINALNLLATPGVDSLGGLNTLTHNSRIEFQLFYDRADNGIRSDTAVVQNVFTDLRTDQPVFTEPRVGSESPSPEVRVIYRLPEAASIVQLTFEADSASVVPDSLAPHVLTLVPDQYSSGQHFFVLDGTDIGAGGPYVLENNHEGSDALVSQTLYNVTLSYRDLVGNPFSSVTNTGYIWPEDLTTVPPRLISPQPGGVDNSSFWVEFELPEQPLMGSVYLVFAAIPSAPGSPHDIYLENLSSGGVRGLFLNAQALDLSGPPVTRVEGGNALHHGSQYSIRVFYQDANGNPEAGSIGRVVRYDGATEPPELFTPSSLDTLAFTGTEVTFSQPEAATPGTVKLILAQTGGPEIDPFSPHVLYLSDPDSGSLKSVQFNASFLTAGEGVDSVQNAGSLVSRGRYSLSISYRDALLNTESSSTIEELIFPSGSAVTVTGNVLGTSIIPGGRGIPLLELGLTAQGESALRALRLEVEGGLVPSDILAREFILWSSVDPILQVELDTPIDTLDSWLIGDMIFDSLVFPIGNLERYVIVSGGFVANANSANQVNLILPDGTNADCGGDPVFCFECPIGQPDIALPVQVTSLYISQDTTFSSLVVNWMVESEFNTLGFNLKRYDSENPEVRTVGTYSENQELYGRGTASSLKRYSFTDRGLTPGVTYTYHLEAVSMDGLSIFPIALDASGTPAEPPSEFELRNIFPNPFNQEAYIEFVAPFTQDVELRIFNILGQPVRTLVRAQLAPSSYRVRWDSTNDAGVPVPSGVYIVHLRAAGRYDSSRKILLVR